MRIIKGLVLTLLISVFSIGAFAKTQSRVISFGQDFAVGSTQVKAGTYRVTFDDKSNELTIADNKTKAVVAKATAHIEKRLGSFGRMDVKLIEQGGRQILASVAFPGDSNVIQLSGEVQASVR